MTYLLSLILHMLSGVQKVTFVGIFTQKSSEECIFARSDYILRNVHLIDAVFFNG